MISLHLRALKQNQHGICVIVPVKSTVPNDLNWKPCNVLCTSKTKQKGTELKARIIGEIEKNYKVFIPDYMMILKQREMC